MSSSLITLFVAICLVVLGAVGGYFFALVTYSEEIGQIQSVVAECDDRKVKVSEELRRCLENSAEIVGSDTEMYDFSSFGIYSPLLEDRTVTITNIDYKRCIITKKEIDLEDARVVVWQHCDQNGSIPTFQPIENFHIFSGYEFQLFHPISVREVMDAWDSSERIENEHQLAFYPRYNFAPKSIGSVTLEGFTRINPTNRALFIEVSSQVVGSQFNTQESDPEVVNAKDSAYEVAETLSTRYY